MPEIKVKNARGAFVHVHNAQAYKDSKPAYQITLMVEPGSENDKMIRDAIMAAAREKFGDKAEKMVKSFAGSKQQFCYRDGDLSGRDEFAGFWTLAARSTTKPGVFDKHPGPDGKARPLTEADGKPYSGCYVNAIVDIWAQGGDTPGIRCALKGVQFWADGDAFSGASSATADAFDTVAEETTDIF